MQPIRFRQELGILWDIVYSLRVQYNREYFEKIEEGHKKGESKAEFLEWMFHMPYELKKALFPFFVYPKDRHAFMQWMLERQMVADLRGLRFLTVKSFYEALQNMEEMTRAVFSYYFQDIPKEEIDDYLTSPAKLAVLIRDTQECREDVKSSLLAFFLDPGQVIQQLTYELMQREPIIRQLHGEYVERIAQLTEKFTEEHIRLIFGEKSDYPNYQYMEPETQATAAFCILDNEVVFEYFWNTRFILIMGKDYEEGLIQEKKEEVTREDLYNVAVALSEKNRFEFFEYVQKQKVVTKRMLEDEFGVSGPNVTYHLSFFGRAKLFNMVTNRRAIEYSINRETIRRLRKFLEQYEKDE